MERLARAATERLFVDDVTPVIDVTGLVHVYGEARRQHVVTIEDGICSYEDFTSNPDPGERCKHALRAELALGRRGLPEWTDGDAVDRMLRRRLDADGEARVLARREQLGDLPQLNRRVSQSSTTGS